MHRFIHTILRWRRHLILAVIATFAFGGLLRGLSDIRDQKLKQRPTDFTSLYDGRHDKQTPWLPRRTVRSLSPAAPDIDGRYMFKRALGHGQEGTASVYTDLKEGTSVVVKTFKPEIAGRNPIPHKLLGDFAQYTSAWPTEIEAGLLLQNTSDVANDSSDYVPVLDYFILQSGEYGSWALVSPFVSGGTLLDLAARERAASPRTADELERRYRPAFSKMIGALEHLHSLGMCHDDVKTDNVFVDTPDHWLLGDLGNLREWHHPWHFTDSWIRQNQWHECYKNDIRRAHKTYLWFLRSACADVAVFDHDFWTASKLWAEEYWSLRQSGGYQFPRGWFGREFWYTVRMTERELICTTIPKRLWRWYWWFGLGFFDREDQP